MYTLGCKVLGLWFRVWGLGLGLGSRILSPTMDDQMDMKMQTEAIQWVITVA